MLGELRGWADHDEDEEACPLAGRMPSWELVPLAVVVLAELCGLSVGIPPKPRFGRMVSSLSDVLGREQGDCERTL